jgi:hypothetical protein
MNARRKSRLINLLLATVAAIAVGFAAPAQASPQETIAGTETGATLASDLLSEVWLPWDGYNYTSLAKCEYRRRVTAQTYAIPLSDLKCVEETLGGVPCGVKVWKLYVRAAYAPPAVSRPTYSATAC